jgi:vacuolar protein sorting-associated protein 54
LLKHQHKVIIGPLVNRVPDALRAANQQALEGVLPEVLPAATELANARLSKVVMVRSEQHASLPLSEFLVLFNEGWAFVVKCEIMARKMIVGLRGVMVSQVC